MPRVKKAKIVKIKKVIVKPRNSGTMTESSFWSFIRSALRNKSRFWKPIQECKLNSRRKSNSVNKRLKFEYNCSECNGWFSDKETKVDHTIPAGSLNKSSDLPSFIERLFCEVDGLTCMCEKCHNLKTIKDREKLKLDKLNNV